MEAAKPYSDPMEEGRRRFSVVDAPDDEEVIANIHELPEKFLECRTIGHTWKLTYLGPLHGAPADARERARRSMYSPDGVRITRCGRCRTDRQDFFLYRFGKGLPMFLTRSYAYPDTYQVPGSGNYRANILGELFARHWERHGDD